MKIDSFFKRASKPQGGAHAAAGSATPKHGSQAEGGRGKPGAAATPNDKDTVPSNDRGAANVRQGPLAAWTRAQTRVITCVLCTMCKATAACLGAWAVACRAAGVLQLPQP
jgi:hypothetical protein